MSTVIAPAVAFNDRAVTARYFGTGDGVRTIWNLAGMDSDRALLQPALYRKDWQSPSYYAMSTSARTNYIVRSQEMNNGSWTKSANVNIGQDAGVAPDGTTTADLYYLNNGTAAGPAVQLRQHPTLTSPWTISGYFKASGRTVAVLQDGSGNGFDLNLATPSVSIAGAQIASAGYTSMGSGWYRCWAISKPTAPANPFWLFYENGVAGDGVSGIYVWGAQLETGTTLTPYIATAGTSATITDVTTDTAGKVTFGEAPVSGADVAYQEPWLGSGVYRSIGTGDGSGTQFSLPWKPVTPAIYIDGVLKTLTTHYTVTPGGLVTFVTPPGNGTVLTWDGNLGNIR